MVKALYFQGNKDPKIVDLSGDLKEMQAGVGGYVEMIYLYNSICVFCNEEGQLQGLPVNWMFDDKVVVTPIHGNFFVVKVSGEEGEEYQSLTETEINTVLTRFRRAKREV